MLGKDIEQLALHPAPYTWNGILAYLADLGWGIQYGLEDAEYIAGQNLFRDQPVLEDVPFRRGGPFVLPPNWLNWLLPPAQVGAGGTG